VAAAVGLLFGAAACAPSPADSGERSISIGLPGALDVYWNPLEGGHAESPTVQAVYDRLFVLDPVAQEYVPSLAKEFELSDDGLTMSLVLRDDVDFVDGVHMDAPGVAEYFNTVFTSGGFRYGFEVDRYGLEFEATGEYSLEMTAKLPIRDDVRFPVMAVLSGAMVASPEAVKTPEVFEDGPVGSGPYLVKSQRPDTITYERNPDYWNPDAFPFDEVTITAFVDQVAAFNALKAGQIDVTEIGLGMAVDAEASGFNLTTTRQNVAFLYIADRDGSVVPAMADVRVRQAMSMALDRDAINEALNGGFGALGTEPFTDDQILYVEEAEGRDAYDLDRARELMAEAGYADGFDLTIPDFSNAKDYLPVIQQSFSEIGIRVTYQTEQDIWGSMQAEKYAVAPMAGGFSWSWSAFPPLFGGHHDAHVEELIATIEGTLSKDEYEDALNELGEIFVDELWFVVIAQPYQIFATNDDVDVAYLDVTPVLGPDLRDYTPAD
jgi:peptide/nickel transport system substrate-binding protein